MENLMLIDDIEEQKVNIEPTNENKENTNEMSSNLRKELTEK